jgi:FixJ family two-component response regulator
MRGVIGLITTCELSPAASPAAVERRVSHHQGTGSLQQVALISIIDDDESVRVATACLVRSLGYRAHTFASAEEFLSSPSVSEASCLIVDVQMPRTNGIELQRLLRGKGIVTPIIFITAFPEERLKSRALDDASSCMLSKPFDSKVLIECLATALRQASD